jgi:hypothetical protein
MLMAAAMTEVPCATLTLWPSMVSVTIIAPEASFVP